MLHETWPVFIRRMRLLTAQAYGARIQAYVTQFYGWEAVAQTKNRGDVTLRDGAYAEYKVSLITASNTGANFVQIRLFQNIEQYRFAVIDRDYKYWRFDLTKEQMVEEVKLCAKAAHVAKESFDSNQNQEWAIRFKWLDGNAIRTRWVEKYLVDASTDVTPDLMNRYQYETADEVRARLGVDPSGTA